MKILLSHCYVIANDRREVGVMKPYPPLGILGIAAFLEKKGYKPQVFDTTFLSVDALVAKIIADKPDLLGLYTNMMTRPVIIKLIKRLRANSAIKKLKIVLGGPEVTAHVDRFLRFGADVVVIGEGEQTMLELVEAIQAQQTLEKVDGIAFINQQGQVFRTSPRKLIKPIDSLPIPARNLIDIDAYLTV